jgi:predicted nucleotidyltransferase
MGELIQARRRATGERLDALRGRLKVAEALVAGKACVYVTGSFGRGEASTRSDLDLFIVRNPDAELPKLSNLDAILLKAQLIEAARESGLPEFDGDGKYLDEYDIHHLVGALGRREDDADNTFTARLLLLLESTPLLGREVYELCVERVIQSYWRDFKDHQETFVPAFLSNDILRLWRTFCVNYEAKTKDEPAGEKAKRKLKNFKLKHSRMLTCYSALAYMVAHERVSKTFTPEDGRAMVGMSPTARLEAILENPVLADASDTIHEVLSRYEKFLQVTEEPEDKLLLEFNDKSAAAAHHDEATLFGDAMFAALESLGKGSKLYRLIVV